MTEKKSILITGCSSGIGLCAAKTLQGKGYQVIATVRTQDQKIQLREEEGIERVVLLDLRSSDSIDAALEETLEICNGALYAIFNNGAYGQPGAVEDLSRETLRLQFETNVFGTHELTVKALPYLLKQPAARIVQNSSILGFMALPMRGAYIASKYALEGLSDTLRLELMNTNVRVSIIEPGPILSKFRENALKALRANVNFKNSRHHDIYDVSLARLEKKGAASRFTLGPEAVVKRLLHALESEHPKARYYVTLPTYLFAGLRHIFPTRWLDRLQYAVGKAGN